MQFSKSLSINSYDRIESGVNNSFVFIIDTTKTSAGSSANNQFQLPLIAGYSLNFEVLWGDGNSDIITAWTDPAKLHTYGISGIKTITINGTIEGFRFNNTGDRLKISEIQNWGSLKVGTTEGNYFYGCSNLNITANDILNTDNVENMQQMFSNCNVQSGQLNFSNTTKVSNMRQLLYYNYLFNHPLTFNTPNVETFYGMLFGASGFDQSLGNLDINNVLTMQYMLGNCGISVSNYSNTLIDWNSKTHQDNVTLDCSSQYNSSALAAHDDFVNNHFWTINDGGLS